MLSKGPPTATAMCKYLAFKGIPPPSPKGQIKKSFKPTSEHKKKFRLKFLPKVLKRPYQIRGSRPIYTK